MTWLLIPILDEDDNDPELEDKAPDQQDDDELAKIEETNKRMKGRLAPSRTS